MKRMKATAYPVQKRAGFYWTCLGPQPAPVLPKLDVCVCDDGTHKITEYPALDCNWFTAAENGVDTTHTQILHRVPPMAKVKPIDSTPG